MEKQSSSKDTSNPNLRNRKQKSTNSVKKYGECENSDGSSHTKFYKHSRYEGDYKEISRKEYCGISESISGSTDSFHCVHGAKDKIYTERGKLKRNLLKNLDPISTDVKWTETCAPSFGWEIVKTVEFIVTDPTGNQQIDRLNAQIRDLAKTSERGFRIDVLNSICTVVEYLVESLHKEPSLRDSLNLLLQNMRKPILLTAFSDSIKHFDQLQNYIGFLALLLMRLEQDEHFDVVSEALQWQLSAPDHYRGPDGSRLHHVLAAGAPVLEQSVARMLALATARRFPTYLNIALLLAYDSVDNCIKLMDENIIENIFYRFNPYFPERDLPVYDINPAEPQDCHVKLGASSVNMSTTLSLLLVLLKSTMSYLEDNPKYRLLLPAPNDYAQRCFIWAYRYECRARDHKHERNTLTVITTMLLSCFTHRLRFLSSQLMPDIMSLAVVTEVLPTRKSWIRTVNFNTLQSDVYFKKTLIHLSVEFLKVYPYNKFLVESQHWLQGLMYLLDPGLCSMRAHWSHALFAEVRRTALQALVVTLPLTTSNIVKDYGIVRRIMWYIEWYSENPYELQVLYWCMRLLQVAISTRDSPTRPKVLQDFFETHGIIIIIRLCYTLMDQKTPPVEKSQVIIALCLRLLASAVATDAKVGCSVYPQIKWPSSVNSLARTMLDLVLFSLDKHFIISDRWLISLLNFIWEAIIWKQEYRSAFVSNNGIYKLLDLITMTRAPVQCIALALVCDVARAGDAVGQLVTWRARLAASDTSPRIVKRGDTIASLLTAVFQDECKVADVQLDENGIIQNLDYPLMSKDMREQLSNPDFRDPKNTRTPVCLAASDVAGSRKSKAFALLQMLSEDLAQKVDIADEAYNLYKNIKISPKDEALLVLCSHYLTIKYNETWIETKIQNPGLLPQDEDILDEFLHIGKGWAKEIKLQQEKVIERAKLQEIEEECSLYVFLGRVRLNIALDALREVRSIARSAERRRLSHALIHDAVFAHHMRSVAARNQGEPVLRTYEPPLDDQNLTGQYVKIFSIHPKNKPKPRNVELSA